MKHFTITLVLLFSVQIMFAQKKQVCFSFDDLPVVNYGITDSVYQQQLMNKLIASLNEHHIPAIGFVNGMKLYDNNGAIISFQVGIIRNWVKNELELGNHTYSHPDYNKLSLADFEDEITKNEPILKEILAKKGKSLRYFRHPFLHVGNTKKKAGSLDNFLKERGYTVAPVTIDNEDYLFAVAYKRASVKCDTVLMRQIRNDFVEYIAKKADYYEKQSQALFGRNVPQILLLHTSLLNSDCVGLLATMFEKKHYEFAAMDEVLKDRAYQTPITVYSDWGISWIDKWALSQGKKGDFFKDEPVTPDYIKTMAQ
jgi:peptidoglycan/xylan/chitin deacetylase (PgdA/CDA1 family)